MNGTDVGTIVRRLREAGIVVYVAGGWGIDALLGRQTRPHADLDLAFDDRQEGRLIWHLRRLGFAIETDQRPTRFVMRTSNGHTVDLHPVRFDPSGAGRQQGFGDETFCYPADGFTTGIVEGAVVPCISAGLQVQFHLGYAPKEQDRQDMKLLHERLGVRLPPPYGPSAGPSAVQGPGDAPDDSSGVPGRYRPGDQRCQL